LKSFLFTGDSYERYGSNRECPPTEISTWRGEFNAAFAFAEGRAAKEQAHARRRSMAVDPAPVDDGCG
jgi:hypothetical protein